MFRILYSHDYNLEELGDFFDCWLEPTGFVVVVVDGRDFYYERHLNSILFTLLVSVLLSAREIWWNFRNVNIPPFFLLLDERVELREKNPFMRKEIFSRGLFRDLKNFFHLRRRKVKHKEVKNILNYSHFTLKAK